MRRLRSIQHPTTSDRVALSQMKGLQTLLNTYSPIMFLLGYGVRWCTWEGQQVHTGGKAKEVLQRCRIIMLALCGTNSPILEYVRTICCALASWEDWHNRALGCTFVEESGEAMLSRLMGVCKARPHAKDMSAVMDIFLCLPDVHSERNVGANIAQKYVVTLGRQLGCSLLRQQMRLHHLSCSHKQTKEKQLLRERGTLCGRHPRHLSGTAN